MLPIPTPTLAEAAPRRARPMVLALLALLLAAPAQAAVELSLAFTESPSVHYPGGNGLYVFEVSNSGDTDEVAALVTTAALPAGVSISGWDCVAPVGDSDCISGASDDLSANGSGDLSQSVDVGAGETITFSLTVEWGASFTGDPLDVTASVDPSDAGQATETDTASSDLTLFLVSFGAAPSYTPGDDNALGYILQVVNLDTAATVVGSTGATVTSDFPANVTVGNWTCTASAGGSCGAAAAGSGELNVADAVWAAEGIVTWTWAAGEIDYASSLQADPLVSSASVDPDAAGAPTVADSAEQARLYATSVSVSKAASTPTFLPGGPTVNDAYTVTISNAGPSDVRGVAFSDPQPAGASFAAWQCSGSGASCPAASGSGAISQTVDIPAGGSLTYAIDVNYAVGTANVTNTASIDVPDGSPSGDDYNDDSAADDSDDVTQTPRVANLVLAFSPANPLSGLSNATYVPGATDNAVTLIVTNNGPSPSNDANLSVTVPTQATSVDWVCNPLSACSPSSGNGNVVTAVTIASGASVDVDFTAAFASGELADEVAYAASVATTDEYDNVPGNNSRTNYHAIDRQASISVTKTDNLDSVNLNSAFSYEIVVTNLGPSDVGNDVGEQGILLNDTFPAGLRADPDECLANPAGPPCWTFCPGDGSPGAGAGDGDYDAADCPGVEPGSGSGSIANLALQLRAGSATTVRVYAVAPGNGGEISNTASIALAEPEVTAVGSTADDSDTDTTTVEATTDILVTKDDGLDFAVPGEQHSYTITVENSGFATADNVLVSDILPLTQAVGEPGFVPGTITWQCRAFDGACCNHNSAVCGATNPTPANPPPTDVLSAAVDLPGQSRVEFTVTGTIDPRADGDLANTASIEVPVEVEDNNALNNSDEDITELDPTSVLTLDKSLVSLVSVNGDDIAPYRLVYHIDVGNNGPSYVAAAQVEDLLNPLLDAGTASWTCEVIEPAPPAGADDNACATASGSGGPLQADVALNVGGKIRFTLTVDTNPGVTTPVTNTAQVTGNGASASDSVTASLIGQADLAISKSDGLNQAAPGTEIEYVITVTNDGPDDVFGATVTDLFPPELEGVAWTCEATTPVPGNLAFRALTGATASAGKDLALASDGRHAYVIGGANGTYGAAFEANALYVYSRDNVPGENFGTVVVVESEIDGINDSGDSGPVVDGLHNGIDVEISADQRFVFVLSVAGSAGDPAETPSIAVFERVTDPANPAYGELSFSTRIDEGLPAVPRRMLAGEDFLFVAGDQRVVVYAFDPVSGLPTLVEEHTADMPATPTAMAVAADGSALFVGSRSGNELVRFPILPEQGADPAGRLGAGDSLANANFAGIADLRVAGEQLYVLADGAGALSRVDVSGSPMLVINTDTKASLGIPDPVDSLTGLPVPVDPLTGDSRLAIAPDGEHLLVSSRANNAVLVLRRDPFAGSLSFDDASGDNLLVRGLPNAADNPGLDQAAALAVTADGRHVLIASAAGGVDGRPLAVYSRRAPDPLFAFLELERQGNPSSAGPIGGLLSPAGVAVSRDGAHVYVASIGDDSLSVFRRTANAGATDDTAGAHLEFVTSYTDGGLAGGQVIDGLFDARTVLVSPDNAHVYVSSLDGDSVAVFARDSVPASPTFGELTFVQVLRDGVGGVDGLLGARGMAIGAGGEMFFVAGSFDHSIAVFARDNDSGSPTFGQLTFLERMQNGVAGVSGLNGVQDLAVTTDGEQLISASAFSGALAVFDIDDQAQQLAFRQSLVFGSAEGEVALALPSAGPGSEDREHVYLVAQNSERILVYSRVIDSTNPAFGTIQPIHEYGTDELPELAGPRDIVLSADGQRVYVASENNNSVLAFDRDRNRGGSGYGALALVEVRTDAADGVDGIRRIYALAMSSDSRHVYAAGFEDQALASFAVGTGSRCTAAGTGDIEDTVDIGVGGTLVYRATARIRADATGPLSNTATVEPPERFVDPDYPGSPTNNVATDDNTALVPSADVSITKSNARVSVVAGEEVTWEVVVSNPGPSNLVHTVDNPVTVTDLLDANPGLVPGSASWTCTASSSGALEFESAALDTGEMDSQFEGLDGASGLALLADSDGAGPLGSYLAVASGLDNTLQLLARDPVTGELSPAALVAQGDPGIDGLAGANAVAGSDDGRFVYVASRVSDALAVFEVVDDAGQPSLVQVGTAQRNREGLDQALHVVIAGDFVYVAGANDNAIAVFSRNPADGSVSWLESEINGIDDAGDSGPAVDGLAGAEWLAVSPDGAHLYAVSGSAASIAVFDRDAGTGRLSFKEHFTGSGLGVDLAGASSLVFSPPSIDDPAGGQHAYVTAAGSNTLAVLGRGNDDQVPADFGRLVLLSSVSQGDAADTLGLLGARRAAISADGNHLYVTSQAGGSVAWFSRNPADGSVDFLGQRTNESADVEGLAGATGLVIDEAIGRVYVAGTLEAAVSRFVRRNDSFCPPSGDGELGAIPIRVAAGGSVTFVITAQVASDLDQPLVNAASVNAGAGNAYDPVPGNNTATDTDAASSVADLAITKDDGLAEYDGLAGARSLAGDAHQVYVAAPTDNAIGVFGRNDDPGNAGHGDLAFAGYVRSGEDAIGGIADVADLLLSADGAHLYAVSPTDNTVVAFDRDAGNGALSQIGLQQDGVLGVSGIGGARALAQSPDGRHLYVAGNFSNAVAAFARDHQPASAGYGTLGFLASVQDGSGGFDGLSAPVALAVSPDGKHVYALGAGEDAVAVMRRNDNPGSGGFGTLQYVTRYVDGVPPGGGPTIGGLDAVTSLVLSADGAHLYVLGSEGTLVHFSRNAADGRLAFVGFSADGTSGVSGLTGARRMRLSGDGQHLYVASTAEDAILRFALDAGTGAPAFEGRVDNGDPAPLTGGQVFGIDGVRDVLVSPDGDQLYAAAADAGALATFQREHDPDPQQSSGALDFSDVLVDGLGGVAPGSAVPYTIRVSNAGPADVASARVVDLFPEDFDSVTWTCTGANGGQCLGSGAGNIDTLVEVPAGGSVTFLAVGVVRESATGTLVNTATVEGIGVTDPDIGNNSATDDDTVLSPAVNLVVVVDDFATESTPGGSITYQVSVENSDLLGPSYAADTLLSDVLPDALYQVEWTCTPEPLAGLLANVQQQHEPLGTFGAIAVGGLGSHLYAAGTLEDGRAAVVRFVRDPLDGRLRLPISYPSGEDGVTAIDGASDLLLSANQRWLFVAAPASDAIAVFERDLASGELEFVTSYQDSVGGIDSLGGVHRLALSADGSRLYAAAANDDAISLFDIAPTTGLLTPGPVLRQGDPGVDGLNGVSDFALSASGELLFAVATDNQSLAAYAVDPFSGALELVDLLENFELSADELLDPVALLEVDDRLLVASGASTTLAAFRFVVEEGAEVGTGELALDAVLFDAGDGIAAPRALVHDPDQSRLYLATDDGVELLSLLGDQPELLASYPAAGNAGLEDVVALEFSPQLRQLYTVSAAPRAGTTGVGIGVWSRERGSRCPVAGTGGLDGLLVDIAPGGNVAFQVSGSIFANATGTLEYSVSAAAAQPDQEVDPGDNADDDVNTLVPSVGLSASKTDNRSEVVAGTATEYVIGVANAGVSDALGALLADPVPVFPADGAGLLAGSGSYTCSANPPLLAVDGLDLPVTALAIAPDGSRVYAVGPAQDALFVIPRALDGSLGPAIRIDDGDALDDPATTDVVEEVEGLLAPAAVAVSPDGRQVLVASPASNSLLVFEVDPDSGALAIGQRFVSGSGPVIGLVGAARIAVGADGRSVFVASPTASTIAAFSRDPDTGQLAFSGRERDGGGTITPDSDVILGVTALHVAADGRHLYAVSSGSQSIAVFAIAQANAALDYLGVIRADEVAELAGARGLAAAPGDEHLYVLGQSAITRFTRGADGLLSAPEALGGLPLLGQARAIALDPPGSRAYLADAGGAVHVLARDWSNGDLEYRDVLDAPTGQLPAPDALLHAGAPGELLVLSGGSGRLSRWSELPLSRCLEPAATTDQVATAVDLGAGGSAELRYAGTVHPSARGVITNTVGIAPASGVDPQPGDDLATDTTTITVVSDLAVTKTGPAQATAGEGISWEIRVSNAGPSDALGMRVLDPLGPQLENGSWSCVATGGSSCPASGSGPLDMAANLLVGDELVITVEAGIRSSATGTLVNRVELVPEPGASDPTPDDQEAEWPTELLVVAAVSVTKDSGGNEVVAGGIVNYRIEVANAGPSDAPDLRVVDLLPAGLSAAGWLCTGSGGATCPSSGSGNLDLEVFVPAGGLVRFDLQALLDPNARGSVSNTASIEPGAGVDDPDLADNSATDTDTIVERPDLSVQLSDPYDPFDPAGGFDLPYSARVANAGPSTARAVTLVLGISANVIFDLPAGCVQNQGITVTCNLGRMAAGEVRDLAFGISLLPAAPAVLTVDAEVSDPATDETNLGNNTDSEQTTLVTGGDVAVTVDDGRVAVELGMVLEYLVEVRNIGSLGVVDILVDSPVAAGLLSATWTCEPDTGVNCTPSGSDDIADQLDLAPGQGVRYRLQAQVDPSLDPTAAPPIDQMAEALVPVDSDINLDNNVDLDTDFVSDVIFRDGFEDPVAGKGAGLR